MTRAAVALLAGALLAACGTPSHDLFVVTRTGDLPGARLKMRVSDGGEVRCNDGAPKMLGSDRLIDARELERELEEYASRGVALRPGPRSLLTYSVRMETGTVRFSDTSTRQPAAFYKLAALVRQVAKGACGLPR